MQHMLDAGMTPLQIFRAATIVNAKAFGLDREIRTVQTGKRANLLLLRVIDRADLAADHITHDAGRGTQ